MQQQPPFRTAKQRESKLREIDSRNFQAAQIIGNYIHKSLRLFFKNLYETRVLYLTPIRDSATIKVWKTKRESKWLNG